MAVTVPSLTNSLYLTDTLSIIAFTLRKYFRTPKDTVPLFDDLIISLPYQVAQFGKEPDNLTANMTSDLQNCFDRIFGVGQVKVAVTWLDAGNNDGSYTTTISVTYTLPSGELTQTGTTVSLGADGRLVIPEDTISSIVPQLPS